MLLRRDALCAAAELVLTVERTARKTLGLVATVGQIQNGPNASNVIPGEVSLTLDVRHQKDAIRGLAVKRFKKMAGSIARKRGVKVVWQLVQQTSSVACALSLSTLLKRAAQKHERNSITLPSGAGHDAAVMAQITPAAMLFVRCKRGISHHPAESVKAQDVGVALKVMNSFLELLAREHE
jgi:allantoate deiminase